jgi:NADPH:quinone reductase-like Zn-dependent oxidoreductase
MPRAYVFTEYGGPEAEALVDWPKPVPGPGQLLVQVHATSVNPADWKLREGRLRDHFPRALPAVLGLEASGTVEAVGDGVENFEVGDEVFGRTQGAGSYAEYTLVQADGAAHKPKNVSFVDAASITVAAGTAADGVDQLDLEPGSTLLVTGAGGGVGVAAVQLARTLGVKVIGTASPAKRALVESLGAVHVAYGEGVAARLREAAPAGIDALLDVVGGHAAGEAADLVTDPSRRISAASEPPPAGVEIRRVIRSSDIASLLARLAYLVEAGSLDPKVTERFPLDHAGKALRVVESGHAAGKIAIEVA